MHTGENFYVHPGEVVSIFSDVRNSGSFGSYTGTQINFFGQRWLSRIGSFMPVETVNGVAGRGGVFKFGGSSLQTQYINTEGSAQSGSGFPNVNISNASNVIVEGSDLTVRSNLNFQSGRLILSGPNVVMAGSSTITGYSEDRFVVTGTGVTGGYLVRNANGSPGQANLIFPVGTTVNSYTPASINYTGLAQNIKVRVFDNVYDRANSGMPDNVNYVPKTWNVAFSLNDPGAVMTLNTQHNSREEGNQFGNNRAQSFISRYEPVAAVWDNVASTGTSAATITSGNAIANAYLSTRANIASLLPNEYFSKSIIKLNSIAGLRIPAGISPNGDGLNEKFVIENLKSTDKVRFEVYNRWQSLVYRDLNYKNTFEGVGNQKGLVDNMLPDGTYYYILNINDLKAITGYIVINR